MSDKLKAFTRPTAEQIAAAIDVALHDVAERYGVHINVGAGRFGATEFRCTVTASVIDDAGNATTRATRDFKRFAHLFGLQDADLHRTFTCGRVDYRITGLNPKRKKYPITAVRVADGREFKFAAETVCKAVA